MIFKDQFIQYVYENMPLYKSEISSQKLQEIVEAFCTRNNCRCLESNTQGQITWVQVDIEETLNLHDDWRKSFSQMGYEVPMLHGQ